MSWGKISFSELVEFPPKISLEKGESYDNIPMDVVNSGLKYAQEINQRVYTGGGAKFANGDTIFARITPCLENGKIAKVKGLEKGVGFGSTEFFVFRAKANISDPDFIYYLAKTDIVRQPAIKSMVGASGRQRADKSVVEQIKVPNIPLSIQCRIASVLSTYDNLIENNLTRLRLLEEKAFLRYKIITSENQSQRRKLVDVLNLKYGKALKADNRKVGKYPVFGSSGEVGTHEEFYIEGPGIIVGRKGNIGSVFWSDENFWPIDTVYFVESDYSLFFLYFNLKEQHFVNTDAAVPGLNRNFALDNWIDVPSSEILQLFDEEAKPIFELMRVLKNQNKKLIEARDILLPKLMSGEIEV